MRDLINFRFLILLAIILGCVQQIRATHNRAGEITYEQIDELTIRATITTYTKTSSFAADRDSVEMFWGDGTSEFVARSNGQGEALANDIKVNFYIKVHSYPSRGTYTMGMVDPNRVAGILNIDFPNSVNITFYIETTFTLLNTQFQGSNSSVVLLQPPIDLACVGEVFVHNPNAYDPDGDSISYEFAVPFQDAGLEVPNYLFPDELGPGPDNILTLNPLTGEIRWESPQTQGEVNLTIRINEYREGELINSLVRDMQVSVGACVGDPTPPTVEVPEEICVIAGDLIDIDILGDDIDEDDRIIMSATGGPFELDNSPAVFDAPETYLSPVLNLNFRWQTNCNHTSREYYQIVFKAVDNSRDGQGQVQGLATLKTLRIKVVAPPPENPSANVLDRAIELEWDSPYRCAVTENNFFRGFTIWRRNNSQQVPFDTCQGGLEGYGYEKIIFLTNEVRGDRYFVRDNSAERGQIYCYRIIAEFAKISASGNPFNIVESIRSDEVCVEFLQDRPLITKVSVLSTDQNSGSIEIYWVPPVAADLDTVANPGPYRHSLTRSDDSGSFIEIASYAFTGFGDIIDTIYIDENLNTFDQSYTYKMEFFASGISEVFSSSPEASSVFLDLVGSDDLVRLSWRENVPWSNFEYVIFRQNIAGDFDSISTTMSSSYTDLDVVNGVESCYKVMSNGRYGVKRVPGILTNFSQEACAFPLDSVAPCTATLRVTNFCDQQISPGVVNEFVNNLTWTFSGCSDESDITDFNIYFAEFENSSFELISTLSGVERSFSHSPNAGIAGCYVITSSDAVGNESNFSNQICLDNCPLYELPNTFTPNADGANDIFTPRINRFIAMIDMEVYNKWGQVVFETSNPSIDWDGTNMNGKELAEGSYYYTARIFESRLTGNFEQERVRTGYINLIR